MTMKLSVLISKGLGHASRLRWPRSLACALMKLMLKRIGNWRSLH